MSALPTLVTISTNFPLVRPHGRHFCLVFSWLGESDSAFRRRKGLLHQQLFNLQDEK